MKSISFKLLAISLSSGLIISSLPTRASHNINNVDSSSTINNSNLINKTLIAETPPIYKVIEKAIIRKNGFLKLILVDPVEKVEGSVIIKSPNGVAKKYLIKDAKIGKKSLTWKGGSEKVFASKKSLIVDTSKLKGLKSSEALKVLSSSQPGYREVLEFIDKSPITPIDSGIAANTTYPGYTPPSAPIPGPNSEIYRVIDSATVRKNGFFKLKFANPVEGIEGSVIVRTPDGVTRQYLVKNAKIGKKSLTWRGGAERVFSSGKVVRIDTSMLKGLRSSEYFRVLRSSNVLYRKVLAFKANSPLYGATAVGGSVAAGAVGVGAVGAGAAGVGAAGAGAGAAAVGGSVAAASVVAPAVVAGAGLGAVVGGIIITGIAVGAGAAGGGSGGSSHN